MLRRMLIVTALFALALPGQALAGGTNVLRATVGPGFTIGITNAAGVPLTNIPVGTYDIVVNDLSDLHNFHLVGPGVNRATTVAGTGAVTWTVTLGDGTFTFQCDPHATEMRGSFTVGTGVNPPPPPAPPPPPPPPPASGGARKLVATVGPGYTIKVTRNGRRVRSLKAGRYTITVHDRSGAHNFHLVGRGVNKRTSVGRVMTTTWKVTLRKGTYRFVCDPHKSAMKGSFRVT